MSPTQRTLAELRKRLFIACVVERRNPKMPHVTNDLFGCIDILAVYSRHGMPSSCRTCAAAGLSCPKADCAGCRITEATPATTLAIQACSGGDVNKRVAKMRAARWPQPNEKKGTPGGPLVLPILAAAGWRVEVWGWRKLVTGWAPKVVVL